MNPSGRNLVTALGLVAIGVAIAIAGIYIGDTDERRSPRFWASCCWWPR